MRLRPVLMIAAAATALSLGACGKRGALERPPPLWGKEKASDDAEKAKNAQPVRNDQDKPQPPETQNLPVSTDRVETGKPDPVGSSPVQPQRN